MLATHVPLTVYSRVKANLTSGSPEEKSKLQTRNGEGEGDLPSLLLLFFGEPDLQLG